MSEMTECKVLADRIEKNRCELWLDLRNLHVKMNKNDLLLGEAVEALRVYIKVKYGCRAVTVRKAQFSLSW
jgi:uncharacterized protein (UPF0276 family)